MYRMLSHRFRTLSRFGLAAAFLLCFCNVSRAQGTPHSNSVSWTASTSTGVTGYKVYRGTVSGGPYTLITTTALAANATSFNDTATTQGVTHFYVVTALVGTNESVFSTQASGTDVGTNVNPPTGVTVTSN